jgi:solute carrier family 25 carnitine/acylcarnitine transporter 20/29
MGMTEAHSAVSPEGLSNEVMRLTILGHGIAGLCAGLTSAFVATPVELLKVKLQLQMQRAAADRQFKGVYDCANQIVRAQGPLALWTGLSGSLAFRSNFFWMFLSVEARNSASGAAIR